MKLTTRRLASTLLLILAAASSPLCAQETASKTPQTASAPAPSAATTSAEAVPPPPFKQLRYEEDYSYLRDERRRTEPMDRLKYIPLNRAGDWYLSIGGELRPRYERFTNDAWGAAPADDGGYFLQRYLLHADVHMGGRARAFVQLQSSIEANRNGGPRPIDEDYLDIHQAFFDYRFDLGDTRSLTVRAGRQEMTFGSSRFVTSREGPNARLSFDGLRLIAKAAGGSSAASPSSRWRSTAASSTTSRNARARSGARAARAPSTLCAARLTFTISVSTANVRASTRASRASSGRLSGLGSRARLPGGTTTPK